MKTSAAHTAFFALLQAALWERVLDDDTLFNGDTDWIAILTLAQRQAVLPLVADAAFRLPALQQPAKPVLLQLVASVAGTARNHARLNKVAVEVITLLEAAGVHPMLLKGQGIASLYPQPALRMCGDIDLFVGKADYTRATLLLLRQENAQADQPESSKHSHLAYGEVTVELHRKVACLFNPWCNARFQCWCKEHMQPGATQSLALGGREVQMPVADFNALYIFHHLWEHFISGGVGLRQLCDWAMVLHTQARHIDRAVLKQLLQQFGLWKAWRLMGCIVVNYIGLPSEEFPYYDERMRLRADKIWERICLEGNFGHFRPGQAQRPDGMVAGKLHSWWQMHHRSMALARIIPHEIAIYYIYYLCRGFQRFVDALLRRQKSYLDN